MMALRLHRKRMEFYKASQWFFSTTSIRRKRRIANALSLVPKMTAPPPPYPYHRSCVFKQRHTGLYGGAIVQFGNNVGTESQVKSRRRWNPNIVHKELYSGALARTLRLKIRTRVLRTIDKVGGLDEYLLGCTSARLKDLGEEGWRLRWAVMQTPTMKERLRLDMNLRRNLAIPLRQREQRRATQETSNSMQGPFAKETGSQRRDGAEYEEPAIDIDQLVKRRLDSQPMQREPRPRSLWQRIMRKMSQMSKPAF